MRKGITLSERQNSSALTAHETQLKTRSRLPGTEWLLRNVSAELREASAYVFYGFTKRASQGF